MTSLVSDWITGEDRSDVCLLLIEEITNTSSGKNTQIIYLSRSLNAGLLFVTKYFEIVVVVLFLK